MNNGLMLAIIFSVIITIYFMTSRLIDTHNKKAPLVTPLHMMLQKKAKGDRLYCMVPYMWTVEHKSNYKERYDEIKRTWGQRCDILRFFVDPVNVTLPSDVQEVPMRRKPLDIMCSDGRPCRHIWEKIWRSWVWVYNNELDKAEWFVKVDDDTFLFPENVLSYVKGKAWDSKDPYYFGHKLSHDGLPMIAGAMVGFSRETLRRVVPVYIDMPYENRMEHGTCADVHGQTEEKTTAICLEKLGVLAEETIDAVGREYITLAAPRDAMLWTRADWWYWKNKPAYIKSGLECCSHRPMAWHGYKPIGDHDKLEGIFYLNHSLTLWDNENEAEYFKKVRSKLEHYYLDN